MKLLKQCIILITILFIPNLLISDKLVTVEYYNTETIEIEILASVPIGLPFEESSLRIALSSCSGYGFRKHPIYELWKLHKGIDLPAILGTPANSISAGIVVVAGFSNDGYGNKVIIQSGDYEITYAHFKEVYVKKGQQVGFHELIGRVGSTGASTGPHIHLEIRYKGMLVDPYDYVNKFTIRVGDQVIVRDRYRKES